MMEALCEIQTGLEATAGGGDGPAIQGETDPKADPRAAAMTASEAGQDSSDDGVEGDKDAVATEQANAPVNETRNGSHSRPQNADAAGALKEPKRGNRGGKDPDEAPKSDRASLHWWPGGSPAARHRGTEAGGKSAAAMATATSQE